MAEYTDRLAGARVSVEPDLETEFEVRLVESSTLAFRVAFSVLRHREDAEDVAQEAFAKAYRNFRQLRRRDRFRAWLVRMTWRLAIDRQRSDRRRASRELAHAEAPTTRAAAGGDLEQERATQLWQAIDDSSVYTDNQRVDGAPKLPDLPTFRQFRSTDQLLLRDGQTVQYAAATDKVSGDVVKVDVTLTVMK